MNILSTPLGFLEYWGIYRAKSRSRGHPRWAQPTRVRLGLLACPGGLSPPRDSPQVQPGPNFFLLVHKIIVKLRGIWTPFDIDFLRCKKQEKK